MSKADDPRIALYSLLDHTRETIYKAVELELAQYKMSSPQVKIMAMLSQREGGMTLNEMSIAAVRELHSISTLIDRMQRNGLVKKVKNAGNQRLYVTLTDKGKDIYENTVTEHSIFLIFETLSEKEKKQLASLLAKLQDKARALLGLDFRPPFLKQDESDSSNGTVEDL